jgi:glycosyltransferase involved in cell wall biosynthesis
MRILYLTYNPNLVSTTRSLQSWLIRGREAGLNPHVIVQQAGDFTNWLGKRQIPYRIDRMPWPDRSRPMSALYHAGRLAWWVRRKGIDLVHCNEHNAYPFAILLSRLTKLPLVCHVRCKIDAAFADWTFGKREPDALIWCTPQMRAEVGPVAEKTIQPQRQHVVPLGLDLDSFGNMTGSRQQLRAHWGVDLNEVVVGMASALRPGKRIDEYLELASRLACRTRAKFFLAGGPIPGEESYFEQLLPRIQSAVAQSNIQFIGHCEPIEPFLHAIDVFVSTSQHESFGMSVCEAMACRKPVAAYAACSVEEVVGDGGVIVATGDLDGLTAAVERLVMDRELRLTLGVKARARVAHEFDPAKSFRQLQAIYSSLLNGRNGN